MKLLYVMFILVVMGDRTRPNIAVPTRSKCFQKCKYCRSIVLTGAWGERLRCPTGWYATGVCGSGKNADCGRYVWHKLKCTEYWMNLCRSPRYFYTLRGYGQTAKCKKDQALCGRCASGRNGDCNRRHQGTYCCDTMGDVKYYQCKSFRLRHGKFYSCPRGYVMTEVCGSGKNADCGRYSVSGKCCKLTN